MKNTNILQKFILIFSLSIFIISCSSDNNENNSLENISLDDNLELFKSNFPNQFDNLNFESKKVGNTETDLLNKEINGIALNYKSIEIKSKGRISGYYIEFEDKGHYIDISSQNKIRYFNVNNPKEYSEYNMVIDEKSGVKVPDFTENMPYGLTIPNGDFQQKVNCDCDNCPAAVACVVTCGISAVAIAVSDGPLPFMDALAVTFMASCTTGCGLSYNCH